MSAVLRQDRREALFRDAYTMLRSEMNQALLHDPARLVRTPAWGPRRPEVPAADVIRDSFDDKNGDAVLHEMLSILGAVARGEDMLVRAALWLVVASKQYASTQVDSMEIEV